MLGLQAQQERHDLLALLLLPLVLQCLLVVLMALLITVFLSLFLARTIVQPLRTLARAAVRVRLGGSKKRRPWVRSARSAAT